MNTFPTLIDLTVDLPAHSEPFAEIFYLTGPLESGSRSLGLHLMFTTSPSGHAATSLVLADTSSGREYHVSARHRVDEITLSTQSLHLDTGAFRVIGAVDGLDIAASLDGIDIELHLDAAYPTLYGCIAGTFPYFGGPTWQFSFPGLRARGEVAIDGERLEVTGELWFDRQWSADRKAFGNAQCTWFGLWLDDGTAVSAWDTTDADGGGRSWVTSVSADGTHAVALMTPLATLARGAQPTRAGMAQPATWVLDVPGLDMRLDVTHRQMHEAHRYYCGLCEVTGSVGGRSVVGRGAIDTVPA